MDTFYRKTRRPLAAPIKRPLEAPSPPSTPKDAKITRPINPPPLKKKPKRPVSRNLFEEVIQSRPKIVRPLDLNETKTILTPTKPKETPVAATLTKLITKPLADPEPESIKITNGPLKGVSTSLLDLIRAKEAAAKETTPEEERNRELLGIAPEIVRIVPTVFTANKREIMLYDKVVDKCFKGLKSNYTSATIIDCLTLMDKVAPEWITTVTISRGRFMRINRDRYTYTQLLEAIKRYPIGRPK